MNLPPTPPPPSSRIRTFNQDGAYASPWSLKTRIKGLLWNFVWATLYRPTPKPLRPWRILLLKLFGADIRGVCYVANTSKVKMPWHLTMHHRACLADHAEVYNLAPVTLGARCTVAQYVYLCTGTHDLSTPDLPLQAGEIDIGPDVFVGAKAFILPGVKVGRGAVVAACAVVSKDVPEWTIVAGNPAKVIKQRDVKSPFPDSAQ
jgi:putative colanic acid biosynthesis acetyltransferase WcaF